jgi:hypothetical protein
MTTEQTEDELSEKRHLAAQTTELADAVTRAAGAHGAMRRHGLSTRTIIRQILRELRPAFPREMEFLLDGSMTDALSGLVELLEVILRADTDDNAAGRRVIGMMEGDPMFAGIVAKMESAIDRFSAGTAIPEGALPPRPPPPQSWATIQRLFKENPSPLPDQAPAIECGVMLRGVLVTLTGSLSETPEGGLRLLSPDPAQERSIRPGTPVKMIEQFFDYEDVMVVAVRRAVTMEAPRIIQSS